MSEIDAQSKSAGSLIGTFVGDVLGAPFEGRPVEVMARFDWDGGIGAIAELLGKSRYTDDTQMMIGVAESLVEKGGFDAAHMAHRFAENYEPWRGYGAGARQLLSALRQGCPWQQAATSAFPDGSFGNGAAMRVAPIGVLYRDDLAELRRVAEGSAAITHAHPLGMEGAALQACAVALAMNLSPETVNPLGFLDQLRRVARADMGEYTKRLERMGELLRGDPTLEEVVSALGNDIRAHASVPAAIYAFLANPNCFVDAVTYAVSLGGDTDTIGAMTGAIAGACHGIEAIPASWRQSLDNEGRERDYVLDLAQRLHHLHSVRGG